MENRVKRLQYEEDRAKKMATLAEERAEKMITARNRHLNDFEEKKMLHEQKSREIISLREKFHL